MYYRLYWQSTIDALLSINAPDHWHLALKFWTGQTRSTLESVYVFVRSNTPGYICWRN